MSSIIEAFAALEAAVDAVGSQDWDGQPIRQRLEAMERLETVRRKAAACAGSLALSVERAGGSAIGGVAAKVIVDVLRISVTEARRRLRDAGQLTPRTTFAGERLTPLLPATAKVWCAGRLDIEHLRVIQRFNRELPDAICPAAVEKSEVFLAEKATELRPDQLEKVADRLAVELNPDGRFSDDYRAAQRGFQWRGRQRPDGMSVARLVATLELRAMLEAWTAKFAAPGMCNAADETPTVTDEPSKAVQDGDDRTGAARRRDVTCPATCARSTTSMNGPTAATPTSIGSPSRAALTTG
jgi:hypothetical protein